MKVSIKTRSRIILYVFYAFLICGALVYSNARQRKSLDTENRIREECFKRGWITGVKRSVVDTCIHSTEDMFLYYRKDSSKFANLLYEEKK